MANSKEQTRKLIEGAYDLVCKGDTHASAYSVEHVLMLVICRIGKAVDASVCGSYCDDMVLHDLQSSSVLSDDDFCKGFALSVRGTVGDCLADALVLLYYLCGVCDITVLGDDMDMYDEFTTFYGDYSFIERCYYLCGLIGHCDTSALMDDGTMWCVPMTVSSVLSFINTMCNAMDIDIAAHVALRMRYMSLTL